MNTFVILLKSTGKKLTKALILRHINHLRHLDDTNRYLLGGPFIESGNGMIVIVADNKEEANQIAKSDPFVQEGVRTYEIFQLELANRSNQYLLDDES
ncbi:MAG: YciI family protein [Bacilli bacterium]|jgi:uncharacterized protein YciI